MKSIKKIKNIIVVIFISISLLTSGFLILFLTLKNNSSKKVNDNPINLIKHYFWEDIEIPIYNKSNFQFKKNIINKEYKQLFLLGSIPVRMYKNKNGIYPINDFQFQIFVNILEEKLPYGPEIFGLYMININKFEGNFFSPKYKQINLSIPSHRSVNFDPFYDYYIQIAIHEYLHYVDYVYVYTQIKNTNESQKLYDLGGDSIIFDYSIPEKPKTFYVNKKFIDEFKNILNYNKDSLISPDISSAASIDRKNPNSFLVQNKKYYSVADKYPVKWMWDRVNETPSVNLIPEKGFENYVIGSKRKYDNLIFRKEIESIWSKYHYYWYKYSEIFARRYSFLLFKEESRYSRNHQILTSKTDYKWSKLNPVSFDSSRIDAHNLRLKKQDIWFDDHPYGNNESSNFLSPQYNNFRSTKLYNLLRKIMGQYDGSNISWIIKNRKYKLRDWENIYYGGNVENYIFHIWEKIYDKYKKGIKVPQSVWNDILRFYYDIDNSNTINKSLRMGGYLNKNNLENDLGLSQIKNINYKKGLEVALGEIKDDGTIKSLNKKIMIQKYNVKKITSFLDNRYVELPENSNKYFWVIDDLKNSSNIEDLNDKNFKDDFKYKDDFINIENIKNKKLVLYNKNDLKKFVILKTTRYENKNSINEFGKTNTLKKETIFLRENSYYLAKEENNFAKIKENKIT